MTAPSKPTEQISSYTRTTILPFSPPVAFPTLSPTALPTPASSPSSIKMAAHPSRSSRRRPSNRRFAASDGFNTEPSGWWIKWRPWAEEGSAEDGAESEQVGEVGLVVVVEAVAVVPVVVVAGDGDGRRRDRGEEV